MVLSHFPHDEFSQGFTMVFLSKKPLRLVQGFPIQPCLIIPWCSDQKSPKILPFKSIYILPQWNPMSWFSQLSTLISYVDSQSPRAPERAPRPRSCPEPVVAGAGAVHRVGGSAEVEPLRSGGNVSMDLQPAGESLGRVGRVGHPRGEGGYPLVN